MLYSVIFPCPFSSPCCLVRVTNFLIICVSKRRIICVPGRRTANFCWMLSRSSMLAIKGSPAHHDTQICRLSSMLIFISIYHFSWVVYCSYTRPRCCLLSARLTQMSPRIITVNVHEQRVTRSYMVLNI